MGSDGKWKAVSAGPEESRGKIGVNLRLAAMQELKAWGVRYLLVDDSDYNAQDYYGHARQWGITEIGRWKTRRLYYIQ
jgi:hypothetical protein